LREPSRITAILDRGYIVAEGHDLAAPVRFLFERSLFIRGTFYHPWGLCFCSAPSHFPGTFSNVWKKQSDFFQGLEKAASTPEWRVF